MRIGVVCAVLLWTAIAWGVASLLGAGGDALVSVGEYSSLSPAALQWLDHFLGVLAGLGKGLVFLVWLFVALVILVLGGLAQGFAPLLRTAWQMRKGGNAPGMPPRTLPETDEPSSGETYDVTPDRVRHD